MIIQVSNFIIQIVTLKHCSGGKVVTNKEEATLKFILKKKERGETLTQDQLDIVGEN